MHKFQFAVSIIGPTDNKIHIENAYQYCHSMQVISSALQKGNLTTNHSFVKIIEGNVAISAIKAHNLTFVVEPNKIASLCGEF